MHRIPKAFCWWFSCSQICSSILPPPCIRAGKGQSLTSGILCNTWSVSGGERQIKNIDTKSFKALFFVPTIPQPFRVCEHWEGWLSFVPRDDGFATFTTHPLMYFAASLGQTTERMHFIVALRRPPILQHDAIAVIGNRLFFLAWRLHVVPSQSIFPDTVPLTYLGSIAQSGRLLWLICLRGRQRLKALYKRWNNRLSRLRHVTHSWVPHSSPCRSSTSSPLRSEQPFGAGLIRLSLALPSPPPPSSFTCSWKQMSCSHQIPLGAGTLTACSYSRSLSCFPQTSLSFYMQAFHENQLSE